MALFLKTHGNFIVVGDLMKSISLLKYNEASSSLEEVARDYNTNWMTALHVLKDGGLYLGAGALDRRPPG
jgi:DNA damage-binding protein 1